MRSFYGWVTSHSIQHCIFFIHSSDDGHLGYFHHLNILTENSLYIFFSEHSTWCLVPAIFLALNIIFKKKQVAQKQWENDYHNLSPRASIAWVPVLSVTTHCSGHRRKGMWDPSFPRPEPSHLQSGWSWAQHPTCSDRKLRTDSWAEGFLRLAQQRSQLATLVSVPETHLNILKIHCICSFPSTACKAGACQHS